MKLRKFIIITASVAALSFASMTFADPVIKLVLNGKELKTDVAPIPADNRVMVPIRVISEALGAKIDWDAETNSVIIDSTELEARKMQISRLEEAIKILAPQDQLGVVKTWAEGVKIRNGVLQYTLMSPELQKQMYDYFVSMGWVTGTSSPWVENYEITEKYKSEKAYTYEVDFIYTDSTGAKFTEKQYITLRNFDGRWLISNIENADVVGKITELTFSKDNKLEKIFVESDEAPIGTYDKANVLIGENTKIYKGYSDEELKPSDLKKGMKVQVDFVDGPMIMIYPPQAEANVIRVIE
ncbi:copper amine oxidase N-terminal domain-containing protein [Lutispora thermophila]|uniref:Copper amine oxidase N-terminal domain-containing protein n=1 Tax=Lutispora thermophila DSM 19022 TaxID=1122184 RepID=A0A1M6BRN7_9FIRM|nr:copper amine oxidase N-terminal domain-containing protein [Lutispora thermophila]SHI51399.1 Copper amine oxidase N-terminal domain-containing protein [Lutispora thermophila DSM 19022]